ncbi:hypothetical protein EDI_165610 [Entamoeba dispar SAW760]|uniref:Uncharacterized protein n=1 Tax=Entamoeba dispar (strain ATCC PRA-260 / SAW760) TaxID=370354 RepID=B0EJH7_ENTDS|nr:uncharacterized protein EDI_165610 [Entamoeba dispar SAW760]EDR25299.1 hypothetical protein EDI_165610 [Entamoeba dispar SAW760]|eukprot:EDR25299.1 hypothetical protein EDI_165610 [Entamoeba dispar SAW760]
MESIIDSTTKFMKENGNEITKWTAEVSETSYSVSMACSCLSSLFSCFESTQDLSKDLNTYAEISGNIALGLHVCSNVSKVATKLSKEYQNNKGYLQERTYPGFLNSTSKIEKLIDGTDQNEELYLC